MQSIKIDISKEVFTYALGIVVIIWAAAIAISTIPIGCAKTNLTIEAAATSTTISTFCKKLKYK